MTTATYLYIIVEEFSTLQARAVVTFSYLKDVFSVERTHFFCSFTEVSW